MAKKIHTELERAESKEQRVLDNAAILAERVKNTDKKYLKIVEDNLVESSKRLHLMNQYFVSNINEIKLVRTDMETVTTHPMFASEKGYVNWQISALLWLFSIADDIIKYLLDKLYKMLLMINAVKEE